jgi:hypothetical protein
MVADAREAVRKLAHEIGHGQLLEITYELWREKYLTPRQGCGEGTVRKFELTLTDRGRIGAEDITIAVLDGFDRPDNIQVEVKELSE